MLRRQRRSAVAVDDRVIRRRPEPDPWVERGVEDVGDQRDDEVDDPDHEDARGQQRKVLLSRRLVDEQADALVVEEHLDGDEAADEVPDLHGDDGDRRQEARFAARACARRPPDGRPFRYAVRV